MLVWSIKEKRLIEKENTMFVCFLQYHHEVWHIKYNLKLFKIFQGSFQGSLNSQNHVSYKDLYAKKDILIKWNQGFKMDLR